MIPCSPRRPRRFNSILLATLVSALLPAALHAHGTSHEVIEAVSREITARPDEASLYLRRAFLHLEHGDWHACLLDTDEAERRQTADLGVGVIRGRALAAGGQFVEAKAVLDAFVVAHPAHAAGLMERARVRGALGQKAEAADDFVRAMAHTPQPEPDHVFELAGFLCRAGREPDAVAAIDSALTTAPAQPALVERAVQIEAELGHFDAALRRLDGAMRVVKMKEPLLAKRAALLAQAGRIRESMAAWRELQARVASLPEAERDSHAMSALAEQTRHALAALGNFRP